VRVIKKNVYYCDYCKKRSLRSLKNHELRCTGNPNRECGVCKAKAGELLPLIEQLRPMFKWKYCDMLSDYHESPIQMPDVDSFVSVVGECHACALAVLKAITPTYAQFPSWFDYAGWKQEYWKRHNPPSYDDY